MTKFQFYCFLLLYALFLTVLMIVLGLLLGRPEKVRDGLFLFMGLGSLELLRQFVFYLTREKS